MVEGRGFAGVVQAPPKKPLIAAIEGYALAGGFELAIACDLIVAAEDAKFGIPEAKRGLVAAGGGLLRLPKQVSPRFAPELALTGGLYRYAARFTSWAYQSKRRLWPSAGSGQRTGRAYQRQWPASGCR